MKNNRNKYILIIMFLLVSLLFSGCFKADITGGIDENYLTSYVCNIELDLHNQTYSQSSLAQENLMKLRDYWKSNGYDSEVSLDNDTYSIYMKKQVQCQNYEDAFEELFEMMTDEYSPFGELSYNYVTYENYSEYEISGILDISNALDTEVYSSLQEEIKQAIDDELNNLNAHITFLLPNHDNASHTESKGHTIQINANAATAFSFTGKINNPDLTSGSTSTIQQYNNYNILKYILSVLLLVLVGLVVLIVIKLKKAK